MGVLIECFFLILLNYECIMDGNSSKGLTNFRLEKPLNKEKRRQLLKKSLAGGGGLSYADTIGLVICLSVYPSE